ncbi:hypothetical protein A3715_16420 [Oleiphilus sp. HI0009]|nr:MULTISPECIES: elongation factor P hydroxylase [unclassified Oleiphilus]KZX81684.1 hypothetical protein A3715_06690 [Oleiphilus sp. HI0009]MCH2158658.1 elongation factor P hydroxylase [Oleiphilaceae bacterium]KZX86277.1 hypothetical protein A3715_16420 [Oleiphilus sp. HI0009]KZY65931.1 hypothetical protein A3738_17595 [Oleiphilus sp. HI0066]KZY66537.1 hypothetical protein A3738_06125 [Oleiphilus sp. HI0066]
MIDCVSAQNFSEIFNRQFEETENTVVVIGASEPYYVPAQMTASFSGGEGIAVSAKSRIFSRSDYPASVMHEVAHWCIAGKERRTQLDYGYWYEPDGRDEAQQSVFERVEVKPQALERILCCAAGFRFRLSADNANDPLCRPSSAFVADVQEQTIKYLVEGLPDRAAKFAEALNAVFKPQTCYLNLSSYVESDLL